VTSAPVLTVSATDSPDPVAMGSTITYTITYGNTGNASASGVVITDTVPANTTYVSATAGGTLSGTTMTWAVGGLAPGASGSVQFVVSVVSPLADGTIITNGSYGIDCNETAPVSGPAVTTTTVNSSLSPTISSAVEAVTGSVYIVQNGVQNIKVIGTGFEPGVVLSLGPDIAVASTTFVDATLITAAITVSSKAALGTHTLTVKNPDLSTGSSPGPLAVVKDPDFDGNCVVEGNDLNILARAWNTMSTDPGFLPEADLDGDGYVGPDDLVVLSLYFGRKLAICP
jgi:uncharacterized repeat protein (TIGR01451 family)